MTNTNKIQWKRLSVEGAAIVASILLAFAIDAWWDNVREDINTKQILSAVRLEMESNLLSLQDSIENHIGIVEAVGVAQDQGSIDGVLRSAVIDVEVFEPSTGAIDTLVAAGMLGDIDNPALQISLSAFNRFSMDLSERESRTVEFRDAARRRIAVIGEPLWHGVESERVKTDVYMLNLLTMRKAEERAAIDSARRLEAHLIKILLQLDDAD